MEPHGIRDNGGEQEPRPHGIGDDGGEQEPRPLAQAERDILVHLLWFETPGIDELRKQYEGALARRWDCGCASIDLLVDRTAAPKSPITTRPAIEAASKEREDPERTFDLCLWVEDGWLASMEIVEYSGNHPGRAVEFPPPSEFEPAHSRNREFNICRVCGFYFEDFQPWGSHGTDPTWDICPCCGTEFGYEDGTLQAVVNARKRWLDAGAPWFAERERPAEWSLERQLAQIPAKFRGELDDGSGVT